MPFVPAPNIVMTEIRYGLYDQRIENRIMVNNLGAPDAADLEAIAIAVWDWTENVLFTILSNNLTLREVVCTDIGAVDGAQYTYAPDTTTIGEQTSAMLPNETAFCVSLRSTSRGRSARGRIYYPGIVIAALVDPNNLQAAKAAEFVAATNQLITAIDALGKQLTIVSYRTNNAPRVGGPVYYPVSTAVATDTLLDSQRRRKPGNGS